MSDPSLHPLYLQDSDQYLGRPGPAVMEELEPRVTFTSSRRGLAQDVSTENAFSYLLNESII